MGEEGQRVTLDVDIEVTAEAVDLRLGADLITESNHYDGQRDHLSPVREQPPSLVRL